MREECRINKGIIDTLVEKKIIEKEEEGHIKLIEKEEIKKLIKVTNV